MMKTIAFILSILIFTLSLVPCSGCDVILDVDHVDSVHNLEDGHDHSHDDEDEACSPFCVCQCCGTSMTVPALRSFDKNELSMEYYYSFRYSFEYSYEHFNGGVWHPPTV